MLKPRLRAGDVDGAVEQGVDAILKAIAGERQVLRGPLETAPLSAGEKVSNAIAAFFRPLRRAGDIVMPWIAWGFILVIPLIGIVSLLKALFAGEGITITSGGSSFDSRAREPEARRGGGGPPSPPGPTFSGGGGSGGGGGATDSW